MSGLAVGGACGTVVPLETRRLRTTHGAFEAHIYRNLATGGYALALVQGDVRGVAPVLARVHSSCVTSEVFGSCDCDCVEQLDAAFAAIARVGRGVVFYLMQEGRGAGFTAKVRDRMIVQASGERTTTFEAYGQMGLARDYRSYEEVAFLAASLGMRAPLTLLTGNPDKVAELELAGVTVAGTVPFTYAASPFNSHYLRAKLAGDSSVRGIAETPAAALPEPVAYFEPFVPEGMPDLLCTASYLLPIVARGDGDPHWFRLHAYFDLRANHERVVLTYGTRNGGTRNGGTRNGGTRDGAVPLVRAQAAPLLDRFPLVDGGGTRRRWHATVRAFVRHGSGCALFRVAERDTLDPPATEHPPIVSRLLAHHLGGRRARPVLDATGVPGAELDRRDLAREGVTLDPPLLLDAGDVV